MVLNDELGEFLQLIRAQKYKEFHTVRKQQLVLCFGYCPNKKFFLATILA